MRKINIKDIAEESWISLKGKFGGASKEVSVALGRKPLSMDLNERHRFDVEICRIPPGKSAWHVIRIALNGFYQVMSGKGTVRPSDGTTPIEAGDAFIFGPDQPHQLTNDGTQDIIVYIVADNPIGRVMLLSGQPEMEPALAYAQGYSFRSVGLLRRRRMMNPRTKPSRRKLV
ncbi:MAG TPA: cupin domain-containing protein [Chthoniobacterales bacterium]|nr:cupin domain-containing protein [Chthoniobacterales bacterium]